MLELFALCILSVLGMNLHGPEDIYGSYNLVYSWPKLNQSRPNCTQVVYSKPIINTPVSCHCNGADSHLQLFHLRLLDLQFNVTAKVIDSVDQLHDTMRENCSCTPTDISRDVIVRINDYLLHYVSVDRTVFLLSEVVPRAGDLELIISSIPKLAEVEGNLLCH